MLPGPDGRREREGSLHREQRDSCQSSAASTPCAARRSLALDRIAPSLLSLPMSMSKGRRKSFLMNDVSEGEEEEDSKDEDDDENPRRRAVRRNAPLYLPRIVIPGNRQGSLSGDGEARGSLEGLSGLLLPHSGHNHRRESFLYSCRSDAPDGEGGGGGGGTASTNSVSRNSSIASEAGASEESESEGG